jgi:tetratricopeptide (TPR) repeat protein
MEAGELEEAIRVLGESFARWPHFKTAELLGECYLRFGRSGEAIMPQAAAVGLGRHERAPYLLARALLDVGELDKAREQAELAVRRQPDLKRARELIEEMNRTGGGVDEEG